MPVSTVNTASWDASSFYRGGDVLGMNRPPLADVIDVGAELSPRHRVLLQHGIEKSPIGGRLHQREQGADRLADISAETQVELRPAAQPPAGCPPERSLGWSA